MAPIVPSKKSWTADITPYLLYLLAISTLGPLQFGFHLAELNTPGDALRCLKGLPSSSITITANPVATLGSAHLPSCIPMTDAQFGFVASIYTLGGLLGALSSGPLSTSSGRLLSMRLTSGFFVIGSVLAALAPSLLTIALGRFLSGIGAGASVVIVPIYISEIVPKEIKGLFGALTQIAICMGILATQLLGYFLSYGSMWRVVLAVAGGIGMVHLLGLVFVAESPQWLATQGRLEAAKTIRERISGYEKKDRDPESPDTSDDITGEYDSLLNGPSAGSSSRRNDAAEPSIGFFAVIVHPHYYKVVIAVVGVLTAQQFCGINSVVMYSVLFLSDLLPTTAGLITVLVGVLNLVVTVACAPLSDRLGRKTCLLLSVAGMGAMTLLLGVGLVLGVQVLCAVATLLIVVSFAVGLGPIPFILPNELVGSEAVGATQSWALAASWVATFLVAQLFPVLDTALGKGKVFFLFSALAVVFFAFITFLVPETKGKKDADEVWGRERRQD